MPGLVQDYIRATHMLVCAVNSSTTRDVFVTKPVKTTEVGSSGIVRKVMTKPFTLRELSHEVTVAGVCYSVRAHDFNFLHSPMIFANLEISRSGYWRVEVKLILIDGMKECNREKEIIGAFANAGLMVRRELINACLYPIQRQLIEILQGLHTW